MKSAEELISSYEQFRALVRTLINQKSDLLDECELNDGEFGGSVCLGSAWKAFQCEGNSSGPYGEGYSYSYAEILNNEAENKGEFCTNCQQAYAIKTGPLAKARKDFGNTKRALSSRGKMLIKKEYHR
jgi:hypothetical protein